MEVPSNTPSPYSAVTNQFQSIWTRNKLKQGDSSPRRNLSETKCSRFMIETITVALSLLLRLTSSHSMNKPTSRSCLHSSLVISSLYTSALKSTNPDYYAYSLPAPEAAQSLNHIQNRFFVDVILWSLGIVWVWDLGLREACVIDV